MRRCLSRPKAGPDRDDKRRAALLDARALAQADTVIEWQGKPVKRIRGAFAKAARRAGVPWCTPHTLKHTAISNLLATGRFTTEQVSRYTETSQRIVAEVYRHMHPAEMQEMAEALAGVGAPQGGRSPSISAHRARNADQR